MSDDPTRDEPIDWKLRCERAEAALSDTPQWQHAEHWKDEVKRLHAIRDTFGEPAELHAEVKRLQEELDQHVPCAECIDEREKAEAERDDYKDRWETLGRVAKNMLDRLRAENKRLRERMEYAMCIKCKTTDVTDCDSPFHRRSEAKV